jgi:type I restriction enzyme S subunit
VGTSELIPMLPQADRIDREFLAFYLRSPLFTEFANANTRGANLPRIAMKSLWKHEVPFPRDLAEQRRIVARIKECIERVEEIELLQAEAKCAAEATLPAFLKETFLALKVDYPATTIGDLAIDTRYGTSRKCSTLPDGTAILRIPNVAKGSVNREDLKYCSLCAVELQKLALESGDLLFVRTNGSRELVGRCAIFFKERDDDVVAFASYLIRLRLNRDKALSEFVGFFLSSTHGRVALDQRRRTSAGQFNINSTNLKSIELPLPPIELQRELVDQLAERQSLIRQMQEEMEQSQRRAANLRDAVLRKAFAGEL